MFVADCTAALALTLAAMEWDARLWEMQEPGRWAGTLTRDADHWAAYGIATAADLSAMLDAEAEREARKADLWDDLSPEEEAELAAELAARDAAEEAADREAAELDALSLWDYEVDGSGRVRFAA